MKIGANALEFQARCSHASRSKEVISGQKTGDYVCNDCGEVFMPNERIVQPQYRTGMIVSPHALLVALKLNENLRLKKAAKSNLSSTGWALHDTSSARDVISVASDVADECISGGYVSIVTDDMG